MELVDRQYSKDGTIKYAFAVPVRQNLISSFPERKELIETAFLDLGRRRDDKPRYVLCLSTMAGCIMQCIHCENQFNGFYRVLTPDEINKQIDSALMEDRNLEKVIRENRVEHAFMGMGEPLYCDNAVRAVQKHKSSIKDTRFAFSTIGGKGYIDRLTKRDFPFPIRLEISLHFPNDNLRRQAMHVNTLANYSTELTISRTLDDSEIFMDRFPGKVALNYALIDGLNNAEQDAQEIAQLLRGRRGFYVKVMEINQTSALTGSWRGERWAFGINPGERGPFYETPEEFREVLEKYGVEATTFRSLGRDIDAACGKMALR